jgi:hypothetical protein
MYSSVRARLRDRERKHWTSSGIRIRVVAKSESTPFVPPRNHCSSAVRLRACFPHDEQNQCFHAVSFIIHLLLLLSFVVSAKK